MRSLGAEHVSFENNFVDGRLNSVTMFVKWALSREAPQSAKTRAQCRRAWSSPAGDRKQPAASFRYSKTTGTDCGETPRVARRGYRYVQRECRARVFGASLRRGYPRLRARPVLQYYTIGTAGGARVLSSRQCVTSWRQVKKSPAEYETHRTKTIKPTNL